MATNNKKNTISFFNTYLISAASISLVLFLFGLILIMGFIGNELSRYVKENILMSVVLAEDLPDAEIKKMLGRIERQPFVKSTEYISKEAAAREMQRELGEDPEALLGYNPFRASIEVKLKSEYTHTDSLPAIEKRIGHEAGVSDILYREDILQLANKNIRRIGIVLFALLAVLAIVSFVLINNTVRLLIYSKRFSIYTMRLVGATPGFIRRPFVRNNILSGFAAGCLAIILLAFSLHYAKQEIPGFGEILDPSSVFAIYGIVLVAGVALSVVAAYFAVNRYLRMARGKLYCI